MSNIKRWIEDEITKGNDPLNQSHEDFIDDSYQYGEWCHYSNMPSPNAYDNTEGADEG